MAALLTAAQVREHIETDLVDAALQRFIDDADAEIIDCAGALLTEIDTKKNVSTANALFLKRRAVKTDAAPAITTVIEEIRQGDGSYVATTLAADDYQLRFDGRQIERLATGTNPRSTWGDIVTITYLPATETTRRIRILIDLVKLAIAFNALDSETIGDYKMQSTKYGVKRKELLAELETWGFA